jgi:hypothetical protein
MDQMAQGLDEAKAALTKAQDKYVMYYNRQQEPVLVFAPGNKVWLDGSDITTNQAIYSQSLHWTWSTPPYSATPVLMPPSSIPSCQAVFSTP